MEREQILEKKDEARLEKELLGDDAKAFIQEGGMTRALLNSYMLFSLLSF